MNNSEKHVIYIITGHYGSGKTEVAVNYAIALANEHKKVAFVDLDIVNTYFRSAEKQVELRDKGIHVITSSLGGHADVPALPGEIMTAITNQMYTSIFDVGGDPVGARVLGRYKADFERQNTKQLLVLNFNRPETATVAKALQYAEAIEFISKIKISGIIHNTHLLHETEAAIILDAVPKAKEVSAQLGVPICFHAAQSSIATEIKGMLDEPVLPLHLMMKRPWE